MRPVDVLAPIALKKLGVKDYPSKSTQEYNAGKTTQIPAGTVLNTGDRRIVRKIGFGKREVVYENNNQVSGRAY